MRTCRICNVSKPLSEYLKDSYRKDGIMSACKPCMNAKRRASDARNPEAKRASQKKHRDKNRVVLNEKNKAKAFEKYWADPEAARQHALDYYNANKAVAQKRSREYQQTHKKQSAAYAKRNGHKAAMQVGLYRARRVGKIPPWSEKEKIREFYKVAHILRSTGDDCVVDHIVPLGGETVCGLHCLANLQYLGFKANASKGHTTWPDKP